MCAPQMEDIRKDVFQKLNYPQRVLESGYPPPINPLKSEVGQINWDEFSDGSPNNSFENPEAIKGSDVFFIADFENTDKVFNHLGPIYALPHYGAKSLTVFIPYFPTATMERVGEPGQIATAKTLMRMLNAIPPCHGSGPARIIIYDIHSLAVQHFHGDGIIVELQSALPMFLKEIKNWIPEDKTVFAFPDEGAKKRFHTFFPNPCVVCIKDEYRQIIIKENLNLIPGNHVVIIDDMIRKGDTLDNCRLAIEEQGASAVSAYVTHGVFPEDSWTRFFDRLKLYRSDFSNLWVTDSCAMSRQLQTICQNLKLKFKGAELELAPKILSLSSLIAEEITKA